VSEWGDDTVPYVLKMQKQETGRIPMSEEKNKHPTSRSRRRNLSCLDYYLECVKIKGSKLEKNFGS